MSELLLNVTVMDPQKSFLFPPHLHLYSSYPSFHGSLDLHTVCFFQFPISKLDG